MSEVARVHSDAATARARIDRIAAHVAASRQDIIDAHRERDWLALGYATWDELCEAEFRGAMIGLPRGERREAVAEMTDAGMSTRAIGAALGVGVATVHRDRDSGVPNGTPVTGLDGKTYQPRTTVEVDAETGEVLTEEQWRSEHPEVDPFLQSDAEYRAAVMRKELTAHIKHMRPPVAFPPEEAAELIGTDEFKVNMLRDARRALDDWHDRFESAISTSRRLRVVEGQ